jgi:phosphoribosylamine--glycine ligase
VIEGVDRADAIRAVDVIHAGTAIENHAHAGEPEHLHLITAGGRVLAVRATGYDIDDARARAYGAADLITFPGLQRRSDIAAEPLGVVEGAAALED